MHNLQIQVGELYRLKIGGGGTPFPRVPPYFDHCLIIREGRMLQLANWSDSLLVAKATNYKVTECQQRHISNARASIKDLITDNRPLAVREQRYDNRVVVPMWWL